MFLEFCLTNNFLVCIIFLYYPLTGNDENNDLTTLSKYLNQKPVEQSANRFGSRCAH